MLAYEQGNFSNIFLCILFVLLSGTTPPPYIYRLVIVFEYFFYSHSSKLLCSEKRWQRYESRFPRPIIMKQDRGNTTFLWVPLTMDFWGSQFRAKTARRWQAVYANYILRGMIRNERNLFIERFRKGVMLEERISDVDGTAFNIVVRFSKLLRKHYRKEADLNMHSDKSRFCADDI